MKTKILNRSMRENSDTYRDTFTPVPKGWQVPTEITKEMQEEIRTVIRSSAMKPEQEYHGRIYDHYENDDGHLYALILPEGFQKIEIYDTDVHPPSAFKRVRKPLSKGSRVVFTVAHETKGNWRLTANTKMLDDTNAESRKRGITVTSISQVKWFQRVKTIRLVKE